MRRVWVMTAAGIWAALGCGGRTSLLDWYDSSSKSGASGGAGGESASAATAGAAGASHGGAGGAAGAGGSTGGIPSAGAAGVGGSDVHCRVVHPTPSPAADAIDVPVSTSVSLSFDCDSGPPPLAQQPYELQLSGAGHPVEGQSRPGQNPPTLEFVPKEPLALNTTYTASLTDGSHIINYTWSFTTVEGRWQPSEPVTTLQGQDQNFVFAVNDLGSGIIAYSEEDPATNDTSINTRPFDIAHGLSNQTFGVVGARYGDFHELRVALNEKRDAEIGWLEYTGKYAVEVARKNGDEAWQAVQTLSGPSNQGAELSAIAVTAPGNHLALWRDNLQNLGGGDALNVLDLDRKEGPVELVNGVAGAHATLVPDRDGGVWAVWDAPEVTARHRSSAGVWGEARSFGKATWSGQYAPGAVLASSADGTALVVFPTQIGTKNTLASWEYLPSTGGWLAQGTLDTEGTKGTSDATYPALAMDASGNALAVWRMSQTYVVSQMGNVTTYATDTELRAQRFTKGIGWEATHRTLDFGKDALATVGLDDSGNGFALGVGGGGAGIYAARWLASSGFNMPIELTGTPVGSTPQLVVTRHGQAAGLWREGQNLMIQRFRE